MNFTTQTLKDALNELANAGKVFSNESQFQFDLAWQLKEMGFEVELEVLSANCSLADFINLSKGALTVYFNFLSCNVQSFISSFRSLFCLLGDALCMMSDKLPAISSKLSTVVLMSFVISLYFAIDSSNRVFSSAIAFI